MSFAVTRALHTCPACGYRELGSPPYTELKRLPVAEELEPPYSRYFGNPSYEVCACCGFEFGNDDEPGTGSPVTFKQYRDEWIADGMAWFDASKRPAEWSLSSQLASAGIPA